VNAIGDEFSREKNEMPAWCSKLTRDEDAESPAIGIFRIIGAGKSSEII